MKTNKLAELMESFLVAGMVCYRTGKSFDDDKAVQAAKKALADAENEK
jgi:hypothetical protein